MEDFDEVFVISSEQIECRFNEEIPPMKGQITWYLNGYPLNDEKRVNQKVLVIEKEKENAGVYQCFDSEKHYFAGKPYYVEIDESKNLVHCLLITFPTVKGCVRYIRQFSSHKIN